MVNIFISLASFVLPSIFILSTYNKIVSEKLNLNRMMTYFFCYALMTSVLFSLLPAVFRPALVLSYVILIFNGFKERANRVILIWLVYVSYGIFLCSVILVGLFSFEILGIDPQYPGYIIDLSFELVAYLIIYFSRVIQDVKKIIEDSQLKSIMYGLTVFLLLVVSGFRFVVRDDQSDLFTPSVLISFVTVLIFIVFVFVGLRKVSLGYHTQRMSNEIEIFTMQKSINQLTKELSKALAEITEIRLKVNERPINLEHHFKERLRVANENFKAIRLFLSENRNGEDVERIRLTFKQLEKTLTEINNEVSSLSHISVVEGLLIPDNYFGLRSSLSSYLKEAEDNNVYLFIENNVTNWHHVSVHDSQMYLLVGNLINNALKELVKSVSPRKSMSVIFNDNNGFFEITVEDNAHEFPIEVLKKLGERGNSTNGTGDGYPEIFQILSDYQASFIISEFNMNGQRNKFIEIAFDSLFRKEIISSYRKKELNIALGEAEWKVL